MPVNVSYALLSLLLSSGPLLSYMMFRFAVISYIRRERKARKRDIRKLMKGAKNFWFYSALRKNVKMELLYFVNMIFIFSYILTVTTSILIFFSERFALISFPFSLVLCITAACMYWFASGENNIENLGSRRVLFACKGLQNGFYSIFADITMTLFMLLLAYAQFIALSSLMVS